MDRPESQIMSLEKTKVMVPLSMVSAMEGLLYFDRSQEDYTVFCNDIERDFRSGMKVKNIAKKRGISKQRVITILKNKGLVGK